MEIRYMKHYSGHLNREMEFKVYGHAGKPVMFIPCQGGRFYDFENFKMIDTWAKWIDQGAVTVYSVDCIDNETYANQGGDCRRRIEQHERWIRYITEEMVPTIRHLSGQRNGFDQPIMTFGASMGAMHAANLFLRRPDLFDSVLALSGLYDPKMFFGDYCDDLIYQNSPCYYLDGMPGDHPYIELYNQRKAIICVGQGAWEGELLKSTDWLRSVCQRKGIHLRFEYWGRDVAHDWDWWFRQCDVYVPQLLW